MRVFLVKIRICNTGSICFFSPRLAVHFCTFVLKEGRYQEHHNTFLSRTIKYNFLSPVFLKEYFYRSRMFSFLTYSIRLMFQIMLPPKNEKAFICQICLHKYVNERFNIFKQIHNALFVYCA